MDQKEDLDSSITVQEVRAVILSMKTGRSPELDGFPAEYYKQYADILAPTLTKVYQEALSLGQLPGTFNNALIIDSQERQRHH